MRISFDFGWLFLHRHRPSRVFRDAAGCYQCCLNCGKRLPASIDFTPTHRFGSSEQKTGIERQLEEEEGVISMLERDS